MNVTVNKIYDMLSDVIFDDYPYTEKIPNIKDFKEKRLHPILATARVVKIQQ